MKQDRAPALSTAAFFLYDEERVFDKLVGHENQQI